MKWKSKLQSSKSIVLIVQCAAFSLLVSASAYATSITLNVDPTNYTSTIGSGFGGEFSVTNFSGIVIPASGPGVNIGGGVFQTFCVETEDVIFGDLYSWTLNTEVVFGGFGGGSPDPLSPQTAYLFTQFWNGTLSNYNYTIGPGRVDSAFALQLALWELEDDRFPNDPWPSQSQAWLDEANTAILPGGSWFGVGIGNVRVLNLWAGPDAYQDVLAMVPEPGTFILFGTGVPALIYLRRKKGVKKL